MKMQRILSLMLVAILVVGVAGFVRTAPVAANGQAGTTLTATVDAAGHWTITYGWTIDKTVSPGTWNLFRGDSGESRYFIHVTKDSGTEEAWVEGEVCVTNGGAVATENLAIVAVLQDGYGSPNDYLTEATVDVSGNPVLDPSETGCYDYRVDIPITGGAYPQPHAGGTYKVTANVTITNHSGHLGEAFGPSPSATTVFPSTPTLVHDSITVNDTNGGSWTFNSSGSESYTKTFTCDEDAGQNDNTATIVETGLSSGPVSVTVNCYALEVTKDAHPSFTRTWTWTIAKEGDQSELTLSIGQQFLVNYEVTVGATFNDDAWAVNGTIWVDNPAPIAATINGVSDVVSPDIAATVDCGEVSFPYSLAADGTLECSYSASLPDASSRTNTATATLQNYSYPYLGPEYGSPSGTTDFTGSEDVIFGDPTTEIDECIDVWDNPYGDLGTVCADQAPYTFYYSQWVGPYEECGWYFFRNFAHLKTNDTETGNMAGWSVFVDVPCVGGCTLTPGYWKTHSEYGPAPYDDTWALLPDGADTVFHASGQSLYEVLWTLPVGGNAYYILAHQYIAAVLNGLNGADTTAVDDILFNAETLFNTYTPDQVAAMKGKAGKELRAEFIDLAETLDSYNNGYIGPGHCSE